MKASRRSFLAALASIPFLGKVLPAALPETPVGEWATRELGPEAFSLLNRTDVLWVNASQAARIRAFYEGLQWAQRDPDRYTWREK